MENLRIFELEEEFLGVKNSFDYPQLSLTDDNGKVWVEEKENYLIATYNVSDVDNNTQLLCTFFDISQIKKMYIDDVLINDITINYQFNTIGEHNVKIYFKNNFNSLENLFYRNCDSLVSLDLSKLNTSKVTDMSSMCRKCYSLSSITFGDKFDTSNVTDMSYMFLECYNLTSINGLTNFNTSKVTTMAFMFNDCRSLTSLDLSNFDTSNVTSMSSVFSSCSGLTSLDLSNFDTSNVTTFNSMFSNCIGLSELDLSTWNTSKVSDMFHMFDGSSNLSLIKFGYYGDVTNVKSYTLGGNTFKDISPSCTLNLCENTRNSWEILLANIAQIPSNIVYRTC